MSDMAMLIANLAGSDLSFAEQQIKDFGKPIARGYLRRCIAHWREHYGEAVADEMERRIRAAWSKA